MNSSWCHQSVSAGRNKCKRKRKIHFRFTVWARNNTTATDHSYITYITGKTCVIIITVQSNCTLIMQRLQQKSHINRLNYGFRVAHSLLALRNDMHCSFRQLLCIMVSCKLSSFPEFPVLTSSSSSSSSAFHATADRQATRH